MDNFPIFMAPGAVVSDHYICPGHTTFNTFQQKRQAALGRDGVACKLAVIIGTDQPPEAPLLVVLNVNSVNSALALEIPADSPAGIYEFEAEVAVGARDLIQVECICQGQTSARIDGITLLFR